MPHFDLVLNHATLSDGSIVNVGIQSGHITAICSPGDQLGTAAQELNLAGNLLCPGLIDGHIHLDKTFLGAGWQPHIKGGTIRDRIVAEKQALAHLTVAVEQRATALINLAVSQGTTHLRTHVDIDPELGLSNLMTLLELRDRYRHLLSMQIVAFPQSGVVSCPGTVDLLDAAIAAGADLVGGLDPASIDGDVAGQLDAIFAIAERHGIGIDIHLHDPDHLGTYQLNQIAQRTKASSLQGQVTVSHAYCLGMVPETTFNQTATALAEAGVAIMTNAPGSHAFPPVAALRDRGVTVFAGSDNIRDAWWPFGDADMLERAMLIAYRSDFRSDAELEMAFELTTTAAATVLGVKDYGIHLGAIADLVVVAASSVAEAVVARPPRLWGIKAGKIVMQKEQVLM